MSKKRFGTDGVRGVANQDLTPALAFDLGRAAGLWMLEHQAEPRVVMGRDTRKSGFMLGASLASGFCSVGIDVVTLGVAPTPAVSFIARTGKFGLGAIVSASHNPAPDNGIKFVGHDGKKLSDVDEERIEEWMETPTEPKVGGDIGVIEAGSGALSAYVSMLLSILPEGLAGFRVAVDGAHGAAYEIAPRVLRDLGAEVFVTGADPDGVNINRDGGATKPQTIQKLTLETGADIGVSFDGDADRVVFSDEKGRLINGDRTMAGWANAMRSLGQLNPPVVVGTVMSNGAFERFLKAHGIQLERTPVGDKYVSERIQQTHALVGGEQSGHIVFPHHGPTGDGPAVMLEVLRVLKMTSRPASQFCDAYEALPQEMVNLEVRDKAAWKTPAVDEMIHGVTRDLGDRGRVVVRASGTQPVVRVMVEAETLEERESAMARLLETIGAEAGGKIKKRVELTDGLGD